VPEVRLRPKAQADLNGIWEYTVETWGFDQAESYLRALNKTFETISQKPDLGRVYDEVYPGLRVCPSGKHLIFYFATDQEIDVVRVLHERMDVASHL